MVSTSSASAIWGTAFGLTKLVASILLIPVCASLVMSVRLSCAEMGLDGFVGRHAPPHVDVVAHHRMRSSRRRTSSWASWRMLVSTSSGADQRVGR